MSAEPGLWDKEVALGQESDSKPENPPEFLPRNLTWITESFSNLSIPFFWHNTLLNLIYFTGFLSYLDWPWLSKQTEY